MRQKLFFYSNATVFSILAVVFLLWSAAAWLVTGIFLASNINELIESKSVAINYQAVNISEGIGRILDNRHGVPSIVARDSKVIAALSRFDGNAHFQGMSPEQGKKYWSQNANFKALDAYLGVVATAMGGDVVYVLNSAGDCVASSNADKVESFVGGTYANRKYFQEAMKGHEGFQYAVGKTSNIPGLYFSSPVISDTRVVGVVVTKINLSALSNLIGQANAFISDEYGVIILAKDKALEMHSLFDEMITLLSRDERMARYKRDSFPRLSFSAWGGGNTARLHRFTGSDEPVEIVDTLLGDTKLKLHVYEKLHELDELAHQRVWQAVLFGVSGMVLLLLLGGRIYILRKRKQNETQLLNILNVSPIAVRIAGEEGKRVVFYNQRYSDLIKNPDAAGDDPKKYYAQPADYDEILADISQGKIIVDRLIELNIPDGSTAWTLASYMPMRYRGENAILGWFYDITKLKQAEEGLNLALQKSETTSAELQVLRERDMDDIVAAQTVIDHIMGSDGLNDPQIRYFQKPAHYFSGDIIAAARDDNGDLRIMLADVTGHGLQAALYLLPISRVFYSMVKRGFKTSDMVKEMNQTMLDLAVPGRFVAAAVAHISRDGSAVEVWNGGIPIVVHVQQNGDLHNFHSNHLPLGILRMDGFDATTEIFRGGSGALLISSDGLTETESVSGDQFGDGIVQALAMISQPEELFDNIISALEIHLGENIAHDDLSIVLAQCSDS